MCIKFEVDITRRFLDIEANLNRQTDRQTDGHQYITRCCLGNQPKMMIQKQNNQDLGGKFILF